MVGNQEASTYRTQIIRVSTFLGGLYFFLYFVLPESILEHAGVVAAHDKISNGFIAVGAMAIGLGLINLIASHGSRVALRRTGWVNSAALLLGLVVMLFVTTGQWLQGLEVTRDVRKVQLIGEFAQQIVDDERNLQLQGSATSATERRIPPLAVRVDALVRYTQEMLQQLSAYQEAVVSYPEALEARKVLFDELRAGRDKTEEALLHAGAASWTTFDDQTKQILLRVAEESNKVAGSYFVLRRLDRDNTTVQKLYDFLYTGLFNQLGSAMFALLGVYIAAAAYRAFRVRTVESALMMTAAVVVMLGQISFGRVIYEDMPALRQWLLEVPNSAAFRAIRLGAGVAGLMLAFRMWLSIESRTFSLRKK